MDHPDDIPMQGRPIPELFKDYLTGQPIDKCLICERDLLHSNTVYMIEKAVKGTDVIYEFAVCMPCMEEKHKMISKESAAKIRSFFEQRVNLQQRARELYDQNEGFDFDSWVSRCILTDKERKASPEHTLYGLFFEDQIIMGEFPYMISGPALLEVAELLSPETKDELGRFAEENLGVPPEFEELFRTRTPLLI